jgi:hypothetical protein
MAVVSVKRRPRCTPQKHFFVLFLVLIYVRGLSKPHGLVRLEGLGKLKNFNDLNATRTHDLLVVRVIIIIIIIRMYPHGAKGALYYRQSEMHWKISSRRAHLGHL